MNRAIAFLFSMGALLLAIGIARVEATRIEFGARLTALEAQAPIIPEPRTDELETLTPGQIKYVSHQLEGAHVAVAPTENGKRKQAAAYRSARYRNKSTAEAIQIAGKIK